MSVREKLLKKNIPAESALKAALKAELDHPNPIEGSEPEIIIEKPSPSTTHLYVIWSEWKDLEQLIRSRIVMDAYEETKGAEEALNVTFAMGLTREEANRLGID